MTDREYRRPTSTTSGGNPTNRHEIGLRFDARRAPQGGTARLDYAVKTGFPPVCGATAARTKL